MKAGFKIVNKIDVSYCKFIIVSNYHGLNNVTNWGCSTPTSLVRDSSDVGMWRVKTLKK